MMIVTKAERLFSFRTFMGCAGLDREDSGIHSPPMVKGIEKSLFVGVFFVNVHGALMGLKF